MRDGHRRLMQTRADVEQGRRAFADEMELVGQREVTAEVRRFVQQMPPARMDRG